MSETALIWMWRLGCLIFIAVTFWVSTLEGKKDELVGSVGWHSSPIDWCEENYEVTEHIVEFWNTLSGVLIIPVTMVAWILHRGMRTTVEPHFAFCLVTLTCVGIGSIYFHATLSKLGQVLDEITICWTNYYAILMVMPKAELEKMVGVTGRSLVFSFETLITVILVTPVWALLYPLVSHVLTVATVVLLPWAIIAQFRKSTQGCEATSRVLKLALTSHCTAVTCWVADRLLCHQITTFFGVYPQLHAFWHAFVFLGAYFTIVSVSWVRSTGDGHAASIKHYHGIPYADVHEKV